MKKRVITLYLYIYIYKWGKREWERQRETGEKDKLDRLMNRE